MMHECEAVLFDWAGTLTPYHEIDVCAHWVAAASAGFPDSALEIGRSLHDAERRVMDRVRATWHSATLDDVFREAGVPAREEVLEAYFAEWVPHTHIDPVAREVFAALRERGRRIAVVSNTLWGRDWHDEVFRRDGVLDTIDVAIYSSEMSHVKPHPSLFERAMELLGVSTPEKCLFVGDRLHEDIWGAGRLGLRTAYLPHSTIPSFERGPDEGEPDHVLDGLEDVLALSAA